MATARPPEQDGGRGTVVVRGGVMTDEVSAAEAEVSEFDELGPVDYLVIEFPQFRMTGEGLAHLVDLVDRGIIRILDLVFIRKNVNGTVAVLRTADLTSDGKLDLAIFEGVSSGLLGEDDIREACEALNPGSVGGILVYENLWAAPLARALRRNGAQLVAGGRIPVQALLAATEALGATAG
jgi:hypothetical protein